MKPESPRHRDSFEGDAARICGTDPTSEQEAILIARIQRGERELFYELIRPYEKRVFVISFTILRNEAEAQDAAQDAFLKALRYLGQFRAESRFSTWLIQVAINEARQRLRKSHLEIMRPIEDQENEDGTYTPRDFADWREIPRKRWSARKFAKSLFQPLARWLTNIARCLSCAMSST